MTLRLNFRHLALATCLLGTAASLPAQDSGALITALIRKGILTNQEAEDIRADLVRESNTIPAHAMGGGKSTDRLSIGMRLQMQYANLDTDVRGAAFGPVSTHHFFTRRMYLSMKAGVGGDWGASTTYDFAAGGWDEAVIEWKPTNDLAFNFGLRKVNAVIEERATSGNLKSIERTGVTRYFVEPNNGRRLGAGSHRIGVFADGKKELTPALVFTYGAAVTNPERTESAALAAGVGDATSNRPAFWANVGLNGKLPVNGTWMLTLGSGLLPDQGGFGTANLGRGADLAIHSLYFDLTSGRYGLTAEYATATVERGTTSGTRDAKPAGWFIQPSFLVTDTIEAVVRYQSLDTDGRGVNLSDVVRSAPAGPTMNTFSEWYVGANLYLRGHDLKYQIGLISGKTKDTITGAPAEAKTVGVRSQMQIQF